MAEGKWQSVLRIIQRKKKLETEREESGGLRRCLNCWDLTAMGVGSTLGIGVYVLVGTVAMKIAGPSVLLSFFIAAVTSLFAGLCYAEFGSRVPLAGSAYVYTYVTVGELVGFVVGWNNILEYVFGSATVARGMSAYIDALTNASLSDWYRHTMPMSVPMMSPYFDLFSFLFVIVIGVLLATGVKESSKVNDVLSSLNLLVIIFVVVVGSFKADASNWSIPAEKVPAGYGQGGFFPYGIWGAVKGATLCFYGFVGFDAVNACGEEVKNPQRTIPTAILSTLLIVFAAYTGLSVVVTMMVPYYKLTAVASVAQVFSTVGWEWARWVVSIGAFVGIPTSLFGSIFPLPRLLYSMASDGLFIHWFSKVSDKNKSPIIATLVPTIVIATFAAILELEQLVLMMCIGTLTSYTIVATCVVLLRYHSDDEDHVKVGFVSQLIGRGYRKPTRTSNLIINIAMIMYIILCIAIALVCIHTSRPLAALVILHVMAVVTMIIISLQPVSDVELRFKTPLVPFIPCLSIYANVYLMAIIDWHTWLRVLVWVLLGIPIYFICICCYQQKAGLDDDDDVKKKRTHSNIDGKPVRVQIVVGLPTPPQTLEKYNNKGDQGSTIPKNTNIPPKPGDENKIEQIQQIQFENNEEKEANIIDLLDQVLQAEEDAYGEVTSLKEHQEDEVINENSNKGIPHRKSLTELSDAGSDASLGNQALSKYDVIAQVHREDLPKVREEEERHDNHEITFNNEDEEITAFNESETNSRTDESGYSDTIDRPILSESLEDTTFSNIPVPPPFDENYFKITPVPMNFKKFNTITSRHSKVNLEAEDDNISEPRVSLQSNHSQGEDNIRFGSTRQIKFMSKLNDIFQKTMINEDEEPRRRSQSVTNVVESELAVAASKDRPQMPLDLKNELMSRESLPNLRPVYSEDEKREESGLEVPEVEHKSMSREDLKSKLENIFAAGGPQLLAKPRLIKSNPSTPENPNQTDQSSTESIPKQPKIEKNDTLKRQKEKFSHVLNSIRLSVNKDDEVL